MIKKLFIILGFVTAILAVVLAVTPLSTLAIAPIIVAFVSGVLVLLVSRKEKTKTKTIQYIFLMVIIALFLTIYKSFNPTSEIGDTKQLEQRDEENLENSIKTLEGIEIEEDF
ncbi:FUSC family protein [Winogradskyella sp.]|uniref:FUSC family protein n=1 Tax=Winogradskyella sp. TaxID=1883156 RepID=UPI00262B2014|nr:FUSC family protein [Winogradskyella sp.]